MSEPDNEKKLLAGRSPAQIVGGMRVANPHHAKHLNQVDTNNNEKDASESNNETKESNETSNNQEQLVEKHGKQGNVMLVNGIEMKLKDVYPTEAVRRMHEKPMPTHDKIQNKAVYPNGTFQPKSHDRAVHF